MNNFTVVRGETFVKITDLVTGLHAIVEGPHPHKNERKARKVLQKKIDNVQKAERAASNGRRKAKKPLRNNSKYEYADDNS